MMSSVPSCESVAAKLNSEGYEGFISNSPSDLQLSIENLVHTNVQIIVELKDILNAVSEYRKQSNIVKTVGTTIGVGGAVALCAAPFTGGLSVPVAISGAVATGTSAVTSIGSSFAYRRKHRNFTETLGKLQEQQELAAQDLTLKLNVINSVVEEVAANTGVDEGTALRTTLYHISRKSIRLVITGCDLVLKDTSLGKHIRQKMNRLQELAVTIILTKGTHPKDLIHDITHPIMNAAVQISQAASKEFQEFQVLVKSSAQSVKSVSGRTILHGVGAAVGVIFSVIDVALLIRDWTNPDPLVATITETIKNLQDDIGKCADIVTLLQSYQPGPDEEQEVEIETELADVAEPEPEEPESRDEKPGDNHSVSPESENMENIVPADSEPGPSGLPPP